VDFRIVFAELDAAKAAGVLSRYAVGGAVAATFYIEPAATEDIDVFAVLEPRPGTLIVTLDTMIDFLKARGAQQDGEHLVIGGWPVQFLPVVPTLQTEALDDARLIDVEGQSVPVLSAEHLGAIALATGRPKDKVRLQQFLEWKGFDRELFLAIVGRHSLNDKWATFQAHFLNEST
jgi:hypothetical protein